ncbi:MAG: TIGR00730 family Rossman fold protein [Nitrospinae bacterium]|nr:TIGR00730 family Rossman fold protein [Nitrospinota bacterium]
MGVKSVCVFCGSSTAAPEWAMDLAERVGRGLAEKGVHLVYGGASIGMMGAMANAALANGGRVTGVIPKNLMLDEVVHESLTHLVVTEDMHSRKKAMFGISDALVCLPGGLGTLEETLEMMTWKYLGIHIKPVIIVNHKGFYDHLLKQFERCGQDGLLRPGLEKLWKTCQDEEALFALMGL